MLSQLMNVDINGNIKEDEKEDDTVNGPWSELRLDLLTLVFSCLSFVDQPAFLCSCKSWRLAVLAGGEQHIKQLWLTEKVVSQERVGRTFKSTTQAPTLGTYHACRIALSLLPRMVKCWRAGRQNVEGYSKPCSTTVLTNSHQIDDLSITINSMNSWTYFEFDFSGRPTSWEGKVVATFTKDLEKGIEDKD